MEYYNKLKPIIAEVLSAVKDGIKESGQFVSYPIEFKFNIQLQANGTNVEFKVSVPEFEYGRNAPVSAIKEFKDSYCPQQTLLRKNQSLPDCLIWIDYSATEVAEGCLFHRFLLYFLG